MSDIAIRVEHLSKKYRIVTQRADLRTLRDTLADFALAPLHRLRGKRPQAPETFWALDDVSFEIRRGEAMGIIGRNGAGKSTLLKVLSRITRPTRGRVDIYGRVGSLLEVGTGFHTELTGRENIYLNGAILGMGRREIARKFDEIVAFAEVERFLDTPVKFYSSGMYVRLAFAVAAHLEPEILVLDEVLAVGDIEFQKKCLGKMGDVAREGRTVLFVSHNMSAISRLCEAAIWVSQGKLVKRGPADDVISAYLNSATVSGGYVKWAEGLSQQNVDEFVLREVRILNSENKTTTTLDIRRPFSIQIRYALRRQIPYCRVGFAILTENGEIVFESYDADNSLYEGPRIAAEYSSCCVIPGNFLNSKRYFLSIYADVPGIKYLAIAENVLTFDIESVGAVGSHINTVKRNGTVRPYLEWKQEELESG